VNGLYIRGRGVHAVVLLRCLQPKAYHHLAASLSSSSSPTRDSGSYKASSYGVTTPSSSGVTVIPHIHQVNVISMEDEEFSSDDEHVSI